MKRSASDRQLENLVGLAGIALHKLRFRHVEKQLCDLLEKALAPYYEQGYKGWNLALAAQGIQTEEAVAAASEGYQTSRTKSRRESRSSLLDDPGASDSAATAAADNK